MPLYEYHCPQCQTQVEVLIRQAGEVAECPKCGYEKMQRLLSVSAAPAISGRGVAADSASNTGCGRSECASGRCMFGD